MSGNVSSGKRRVNWWIVVAAGVAAGLLDLIYAGASIAWHGMPVMLVPLAIASGVLGPAAFHGGMGVAVLGLLLHLGILVAAAALYMFASLRLSLLVARPLVSGMLYGLGVYLFMHMVVLPLSLAPPLRSTPGMMAMDIAVHVLVLGPVLSLAATAIRPTRVPREFAAF